MSCISNGKKNLRFFHPTLYRDQTDEHMVTLPLHGSYSGRAHEGGFRLRLSLCVGNLSQESLFPVKCLHSPSLTLEYSVYFLSGKISHKNSLRLFTDVDKSASCKPINTVRGREERPMLVIDKAAELLFL